MPLIEENIGIGFVGVYPDKRCARCLNVAPVALRRNEIFSRPAGYENNGANHFSETEYTTFATLLYK
jgi:hypothetical protein